jgi:HAD superfamily hydrolase (TIGR01509 family)
MQILIENHKFPSCLLSDCDGVIVDSEKIADEIMLEILRETFANEVLDTHTKDMFGRRVIDIIVLLENRLGISLSADKRSHMQMDIDSRVAQEATAMPKVKEVYESLGIPVAIVSNSAVDRLRQCVQRAGLIGLVGSNMYSGDEVSSPKPAPDVYLKAAQTMGFSPEQCLVIEDSVTGVIAAKAAGMCVLGFLGGSHIRPDHADTLMKAGAQILFDNMTELPQVIQNLNL